MKKYYTRKDSIVEWIYSEEKPIKYKLVALLNKDGSKGDGWWSGFCWDGQKVDSEKVVAWEKLSYNNSQKK